MCVSMDKLIKIVKLIEEFKRSDSSLSEIDTQFLLVEPVLWLAGYDIYNPYIVRRASRSPHSKFDIEVYKNGKLFLVIEVKSFSSSEFNIDKQDSEIGKLIKKCVSYTNRPGDGVGQLRLYCLNDSRCKNDNDIIPILTNGKEWVLFDIQLFRNNPESPINSKMIIGRAKVTDEDFYEKIIKKIKNT